MGHEEAVSQRPTRGGLACSARLADKLLHLLLVRPADVGEVARRDLAVDRRMVHDEAEAEALAAVHAQVVEHARERGARIGRLEALLEASVRLAALALDGERRAVARAPVGGARAYGEYLS